MHGANLRDEGGGQDHANAWYRTDRQERRMAGAPDPQRTDDRPDLGTRTSINRTRVLTRSRHAASDGTVASKRAYAPRRPRAAH
jgi:hypothetical protein